MLAGSFPGLRWTLRGTVGVFGAHPAGRRVTILRTTTKHLGEGTYMASANPIADRQQTERFMALISALMNAGDPLIDRRQAPRRAITRVFSIQPIDGQGTPCGEEVSAVTRDISLSGASLFVPQLIDTPFLLIKDTQGEMAIQIKLRIQR